MHNFVLRENSVESQVASIGDSFDPHEQVIVDDARFTASLERTRLRLGAARGKGPCQHSGIFYPISSADFIKL
jgi:hypothetical protein